MKQHAGKRTIASFAMVGMSVFAGALVAGCSSQNNGASSAPAVVRGVALSLVRTEPVPNIFMVSGTVQPENTAQIAPRIMGTVESIPVIEGSVVRAGQLLARIDAAQAQEALQQAQAGARAAQQQMNVAQSAQSLAASTLQRYELLRTRKSVSAQEYDEVRQHLQVAQAQFEAAQANAAQANAAVAQAQTTVAYADVRAPFAGVITRRFVDPGAMAAPGAPLFTLESTGPLHLEVNVDESDLAWLRVGALVPVRIDGATKTAQGRVVRIYPAADAASRSFTVKISLPQLSMLRSGLYGSAEFSRGSKDGILIPESAILHEGNLTGLYVIGADGIAQLRYVTLGQAMGDKIAVLAGLSPGETIVVASQGRGLDGKRVEVQP